MFKKTSIEIEEEIIVKGSHFLNNDQVIVENLIHDLEKEIQIFKDKMLTDSLNFYAGKLKAQKFKYEIKDNELYSLLTTIVLDDIDRKVAEIIEFDNCFSEYSVKKSATIENDSIDNDDKDSLIITLDWNDDVSILSIEKKESYEDYEIFALNESDLETLNEFTIVLNDMLLKLIKNNRILADELTFTFEISDSFKEFFLENYYNKKKAEIIKRKKKNYIVDRFNEADNNVDSIFFIEDTLLNTIKVTVKLKKRG